jgi:hypothetical protein
MKLEEIRAKIAGIVDTRHQGYVEHKPDVLIIVMCAVRCGLDELCLNL